MSVSMVMLMKRYMFLVLTICFAPGLLSAQTFESGSDGSDGALTLTDPGTVIFDPKTMGYDADGDNIFHFTTITIGSGVTVRLSAEYLGSNPVMWLATGDVVIDGVLNLNGDQGHEKFDARMPAWGGAGGYNGGVGSNADFGSSEGQGPGAGVLSIPWSTNANHATNENNASAYGNRFLVPLIGGSGGAGGFIYYSPQNAFIYSRNINKDWWNGGGGGGGGALLLSSTTSIALNGSITANGGARGGSGGAGSGGAIRIATHRLTGSGTLRADGGGGSGKYGRIRVEAFELEYNPSGSTYPAPSMGTPAFGLPPGSARPSLAVVSVGSVQIPASASGSFNPADLTFYEADPVDFAIAASNVPLGTVVKLVVFSEVDGVKEFDSTPLQGTLENSTATVTIPLPKGFSRYTVYADWSQ